MSAPRIHYRMADETLATFVDTVLYESKDAAEAAAAELIKAHGGPALIYVYALAAQVTVAVENTDVA